MRPAAGDMMPAVERGPLVLTTFADVQAGFANPDLSRNVDPEVFERGNVLEGVLMMLDGAQHRDRRRAENSLFRRDRMVLYERELFPAIVDGELDQLLATGRADLLEMGALLAVVLSARTSGVDLDLGSIDQHRQLVRWLRTIIKGVAIDGATGNIEQLKADVRVAISEMEAAVVTPSWHRRERLLAEIRRGATNGDAMPNDLLSLLLRSRATLGVDDGAILREVAFFLVAGADTTAQTVTSSMDCIFAWTNERPSARDELLSSRLLIQQCVHEAIRLKPPNPTPRRRALTDSTLVGRTLPKGTQVVLDVGSANRDPSIFGADADRFDPYRGIPDGVARYGHSFGGGVHACIGRALAVGLSIRGEGAEGGDHLFGLVTLLVEALLSRGIRPDPDRPPAGEADTLRWTRWSSYPVVLAG